MSRNTISSLMLLLLVVSLLVGASRVQPASADNVDWWSMFHHDTSRTGTSTSTGPTANNLLWTYTTGDMVESSPAVAGGLVYVGSFDDNVYCLNATNGAKVWNYTTGATVFSSPAVVGGLVYVGSVDHNVYCLNATTGAQVWTYMTGFIVDSCPAVAGGLVYIGSGDGNVYCLNATNGAKVWNYTTIGLVDSSPAIVGGMVYVGSGDVYCLNAATGARVWSFAANGVVGSSPAIAGGMVYVGSADNNVYCLNATTGSLVWSYPTGWAVESSPAIAGGLVYVGSDNGNVYCLNATNGALVWSYTTGAGVWSSPAVVGGLVYVGSFDDNVYCLNAADGSLVWRCGTGGSVYSSPAVVSGVVYVGSDDGNIYAFGGSVQPSTSVSCLYNPVLVGEPVTCVATVSGSNPTGNVTWSTNSSTGSFSSSTSNLSSGSCSTTYTDTSTGTVIITASYSGDADNVPSSGSTTLTVTQTGTYPEIILSPTQLLEETIGQTFTLTVNLTDFPDLTAYEVVLKYNGTILNMTGVTFPNDYVFSGQTLVQTLPPPPSTETTGDAKDGLNWTMAGADLIGSGSVAVSNGILLEENFTVIGLGKTTITLATINNPFYFRNGGLFGTFYTDLLDVKSNDYNDFATQGCAVFATPLVGDINHDGKVDIKDIHIAALAYGSCPGDSNWTPDADVNGDGKVDIKDIALIAKNYGSHT